jgi:endonuclease/exonuclease/phosphatase family metal-dependent hydrolase
MTWNIHKGIGGVDRRYAIDRIVSVLSYYDPDIALLQEVAQGMPGLREDDQVALLTDAFDGHAAFHPEHQFRRGGYGNLILSRWPLFDIAHLDLTVGFRKRRGLVQAHVRARWSGHSRTIVVHNLHLGLAGSERGEQLRRFIDCDPFKRLHKATPVIVGGDLNDLWGSLGPKHLAPSGFTRAGSLSNTFPAAYPVRPLDGLFYRGNLTLRDHAVGRSRLAQAASDHLPLYADFDLY